MFLAPWLLALVVTAGTNPSNDTASSAVLLDFTSRYCGPCQATRPAVERLKREGYPVREIDVDESPQVAKRYRVSGVPTFIVVDAEGAELGRTTGAMDVSELAQFYHDNASTASNPPRTRASRSQDDDDDTPAISEGTAAPWETVVRIKVLNHLSRPRQSIGFGSGTVIHSTERESIILTCAHIFKIEELRTQPTPSRFPLKVRVDLFDGRLSPQASGKTPQVHTAETDIPADVIDYDYVGDVGLIRIRPGKRLPVSKIVPPGWTPKLSMKMTTVGCSHGHDATAWSTEVTRPLIRLQQADSAIYEATECLHKPLQGRSGGGLFTIDGLLAGVCDFNDGRSRGLYASPRTIHKLIDKHELQICYAGPDGRQPRPDVMLASRRGGSNRRDEMTVRGQSPSSDSGALPIPSPELLNVRLPGEVLDAEDTESVSVVRRPKAAGDSWKAPGEFVALSNRENPGRRARETSPATAGLKMDSSVDSDIFAAAPDFEELNADNSARAANPGRPREPDSWRSSNGSDWGLPAHSSSSDPKMSSGVSSR